MMKLHNILYPLIFLAGAVVSCQKPDRTVITPDRSNELALTVNTPDTKTELTEDNVSSIVLYGYVDNFAIWMLQKPNYRPNERTTGDSCIVSRPADKIWRPDPPHTWDNNAYYTFHAYAYDIPQKAKDAGGSLTIEGKGQKINVTQPYSYFIDPATGEHNCIDYLLSYLVKYNPSPSHPLVPIQLEHAMAKVTLYMEKNPKIEDRFFEEINVEFRNIKRQTTLVCAKHKELKNDLETQNVWASTLGSLTTTYSYMGIDPQYIKQKGQGTVPVMTFIAVPVDKAAMKDYVLSITFKINTGSTPETSRTYHSEYNLGDAGIEWQSGHNTQYRYVIDNDIHLYGSIKDWESVDYIEGTVLPPINDENQLN